MDLTIEKKRYNKNKSNSINTLPARRTDCMTLETRTLKVTRQPGEYSSDHKRVIARILNYGSEERTRNMISRLLEMDEDSVITLYQQVKRDYEHRHRDFEAILKRHFDKRLLHYFTDPQELESLSHMRKMLMASYFTMEYSVESAALFNPSIVPHFNQEGVPPGSVRFIMSLRATGEGHISSIVFRSGLISGNGVVSFDEISRYIETPTVDLDAEYDKHLFQLKLSDIGALNEMSDYVLTQLPDRFDINELLDALERVEQEKIFPEVEFCRVYDSMRWLADCNYQMEFHKERPISERVIFPISSTESNGIEDARFVQFIDDDGFITYYATYTAFNGHQILPQLLETTDFVRFNISTLNGEMVQNKGMALFPRKINGKYAMIGRQDGVNLYIMYSDHLHFWNEAELLLRPDQPWELTQIGNCGSPVETEAGWVLLTHGVGPMRRYCIGAVLLDLEDPSRVIGHLAEPLIAPSEEEREGYVPNVVYTCGCIVHNNNLVIPYAMSDSKFSVASIPLEDLLEHLEPNPHILAASAAV